MALRFKDHLKRFLWDFFQAGESDTNLLRRNVTSERITASLANKFSYKGLMQMQAHKPLTPPILCPSIVQEFQVQFGWLHSRLC